MSELPFRHLLDMDGETFLQQILSYLRVGHKGRMSATELSRAMLVDKYGLGWSKRAGADKSHSKLKFRVSKTLNKDGLQQRYGINSQEFNSTSNVKVYWLRTNAGQIQMGHELVDRLNTISVAMTGAMLKRDFDSCWDYLGELSLWEEEYEGWLSIVNPEGAEGEFIPAKKLEEE